MIQYIRTGGPRYSTYEYLLSAMAMCKMPFRSKWKPRPLFKMHKRKNCVPSMRQSHFSVLLCHYCPGLTQIRTDQYHGRPPLNVFDW